MTLIDQEEALDALNAQAEEMSHWHERYAEQRKGILTAVNIVTDIESREPEIIRCKECKHNPKKAWFGCPMAHLNERQRPEDAWCWRGERADGND